MLAKHGNQSFPRRGRASRRRGFGGPTTSPQKHPGTAEVAVNPFWSENAKKELRHYGEEGSVADRRPEAAVPEHDQGQTTQFMVV